MKLNWHPLKSLFCMKQFRKRLSRILLKIGRRLIGLWLFIKFYILFYGLELRFFSVIWKATLTNIYLNTNFRVIAIVLAYSLIIFIVILFRPWALLGSKIFIMRIISPSFILKEFNRVLFCILTLVMCLTLW